MNKSINIFGFEVDVTYRVADGEVVIDKTSVKNAGNIEALMGMDIVSTAKEILEEEMLTYDELFVHDGEEPKF